MTRDRVGFGYGDLRVTISHGSTSDKLKPTKTNPKKPTPETGPDGAQLSVLVAA